MLIRRDGMAVHAFVRHCVKPGKDMPVRFEECAFDETTGNRFGWVPVETSGLLGLAVDAINAHDLGKLLPGTYELVGPKVNGNPDGWADHRLIEHATAEQAEVPRLLLPERIKDVTLVCLSKGWEGLVFTHPVDGRQAKIKVRDYMAHGRWLTS